MALHTYHTKRDFTHTPEPKGEEQQHTTNHLVFVVQEHHASRLHYDFRLELDGVLKSWAIPKGPSMNPHDHHLAVMTEDHPYDYRTFEGVIPKGNYGAGKVIIWDAGWYEPRQETDDPERAIRKGLDEGHVTFIMHGQKLSGEFALVKMAHVDDDAWLLIKKGDDFASESDITKKDTSIVSGKRVDEIGANSMPDISVYPKVIKPWVVKPMLATLTDDIFDKPGWLFEIKWDGFRAVGTKHKDSIQLYSRIGTDFMAHYPPIAEALRDLPHDCILDGEIVVVDDQGMPHFEWLQNWRRAPQGTLLYHVFDVLWVDGRDLRTMPLLDRKKVLRDVIPEDSPIRYSDHIETNGKDLFAQMQERGLEGVVAKDVASQYLEGHRGSEWLKIKTHLRQEVVIGGYTEPRGGRKYIGALIVGVYDKGEFVYVGHSGGGIPDELRKELLQSLQKIELKTSPFKTEPKPNAPVHWVKPQLVAEMNFSEWTSDGSMRHPQFVGMRSDKNPLTIKREIAKSSSVMNKKSKEARVPVGKNEFTHLDKVFFPKHGYTKGDLIEYYTSVADVMLPYLKDRPHSMLRQPNGITGPGFFQKNNEHLPSWVPSADIFSDSNNANLHWIVGGRLDTLLYMVQLGTIEINPWSSRVKNLENPDWIVIDLDPEGPTFKDVITVAREVKNVCDEWHIPCYPKTSGKTGIHIFIPLAAKYDYEQAKNFAHLIVIEVNKRQPKLTSLERMPEKRRNKIYLDFLQNREGQTLAAPYSVRPTPEATVSTPLHWDEVVSTLKPTDFTIKNIGARIKKIGDIWKPVMQKGVDIAKVLKHLDA